VVDSAPGVHYSPVLWGQHRGPREPSPTIPGIAEGARLNVEYVFIFEPCPSA